MNEKDKGLKGVQNDHKPAAIGHEDLPSDIQAAIAALISPEFYKKRMERVEHRIRVVQRLRAWSIGESHRRVVR